MFLRQRLFRQSNLLRSSFMATFYSPDDPIFYLHHCFVDFIWALWQDCNDYDGTTHASGSSKYDGDVHYQLDYSPVDSLLGFSGPRVSGTFDILNDYDVSYAKGDFFVNAQLCIHAFIFVILWHGSGFVSVLSHYYFRRILFQTAHV